MMFLISFGLLFDLLSFCFGLMGVIQKRHVSGFPLVGIVFYALAVVISFLSSERLFDFPIFYEILMLIGIPLFFNHHH